MMTDSLAHIHPELVIYHANCDDGFCAAWIHKRHSVRGGEYVPAQYGSDPPDVQDRDVLIFDFSYPRDVLLAMKDAAHSLLVFDHHKTAEAALAGLDFCTFERDKSGARMALEYMGGEGAENWLVDYVEDRDMWWKKLLGNRHVRAALHSYPYDFKVWDGIFGRGAITLRREGQSLLRYQNLLLEAAVANHGWMQIEGHTVPCVNNTLSSLTSDLVGKLAEIKDVPFAVGFFVLTTGPQAGQVVYNLRSRGEFDVSELAKKYGGGGHQKAAGFTYPELGVVTGAGRGGEG